MKKIVKSLIFPAIAILIVAIIYAGLSIENLNNQTKVLQKQNQTITYNANSLQNTLSQLQNEVNQTKFRVNQSEDLNNSLKQSLAAAQKQILALQANTKTKTSANLIPEPVIITKTITQTINQPVVLNQASVIIENVGSFKVNLQAGDNAFSVLQRASNQNNFALAYDTYSFGVFITGIGGITPTGNQYWAFYYNGTFSNVGASDQPVKLDDSMVWQLASF